MMDRLWRSFSAATEACATKNETAGREARPRWIDKSKLLLGFLLLLLADADLEVSLLRFLIRLVVVPGDSIAEVCVNVSGLREHRHQRETLVAGGAEGPETLYVGDCHTFLD